MITHLKYVLAFWVLILLAGKDITAQPTSKQLSLRNNSCLNFIHITGESNINQFSFTFNQADNPGPGSGRYPDTADVIIRIPIREFRASNQMMYDDFLHMMKESEYPLIEICLKRKQLNDRVQSGNNSLCPDIRITIAGVTKIYKIDCFLFPCAENLFIQGEKKLRLTDFHLTPPVKLKGLVKVSDDINVDFGFMITIAEGKSLATKWPNFDNRE
jgi:hypothetical protein